MIERLQHMAKKVGRPLYGNRRLISYYWERTRRNKLAVFGLAFILLLILLGVVGPFCTMDPTMVDFEEKNLPPNFFSAKLHYLFSHPEELENMRNQALKFSKPLAAKAIARHILEYFMLE